MIESVISIGVMTLKESPTAGGTPSPRLILSFSMLENLMKMVVAMRPMMMAAKRPLVPVLLVRNAPVTSAVVPAVASVVTVTVCGIMMTSEAMPTTTQAMGLSKRLFLAKQ